MPANKSELKIGDKAPDFNLPTGGEGKLKLSDLRGRKVVPYFYPKDNTSGCTKEACGFNEELPDFRKLKAEIVGVSRDSVASHAGFKKKYGLGFKLVSDAGAKACAAYGTWVEKSM